MSILILVPVHALYIFKIFLHFIVCTIIIHVIVVLSNAYLVHVVGKLALAEVDIQYDQY